MIISHRFLTVRLADVNGGGSGSRAATTSPLLQTKFHVPRRRRGVVERPRLRGALDLVSLSTLTLVSAPAGFGKSTLVTEWVATAPTEGYATAWLSLDQRDNDPGLFWRYLIAALQTAAPDVGAGAGALPITSSRPRRCATR